MHLTDCFIELIAYIAYFQKTVATRQPPYDQVKSDILRLLTQSETCTSKGLFSADDYDHARYVVCAWVDEAILNSAWNLKGQWQREQLQRLYYNTTDAGEKVYERLNSLGLHQKAIREVYQLCLSLGFMGRYNKKEDSFLLDQLKTSNLKLLMGDLPSFEKNELFPEAFPLRPVEIGPDKKEFRFSPVAIMGLLGPILLFGFLFVIYRFSLSGISENFLSKVP